MCRPARDASVTLLAHLFPFVPVRSGEARRRVRAPPERVYAALLADPTPEDLRRWRMEGFRRVDARRAAYRQHGQDVVATLEPVAPPWHLRSVTVAGGEREEHEWRLAPVRDETVLVLRVRLPRRTPAGRVARTLEAALDGVEARVAAP